MQEKIEGGFNLLRQSYEIFLTRWKKLFWFVLFFPALVGSLGILLAVTGESFYTFITIANISLGAKVFFGLLYGAAMIIGAIIIIYISVVANAAAINVIDSDLPAKDAFKKGADVFWRLFFWMVLFGILIAVGFIFFIIPAIILIIYFSFGIFAVTLEGTSPGQSFRASSDLVKGFWWTVLARALIIFFFLLIFSVFRNLFQESGMELLAMTSPSWLITGLTILGGLLLLLVAFIISYFVNSLWLIYGYLIWKRLKQIKKDTSIVSDKMQVWKKILLALFILLLVGSFFVMVIAFAVAGGIF